MKWNRVAIHELCCVAQITDRELVAYVDWDLAAFRRAYKTNQFPGPVCIALDVFEAKVKLEVLGERPNFDLPFCDITT